MNRLKLSEFGNLPPATIAEAAESIQRLILAFPQMKDTFFGVLAKYANEKRLSKARIDYAVNWLLENHHYPMFTLADFLSADKEMHHLDYNEYMSLHIPHKPLAVIRFGAKTYIVYKEDAERCGYPYKPFFSVMEQEEIKRQEKETRWKKEREELLRQGKIRVEEETKVGDFNTLIVKLFRETDNTNDKSRKKHSNTLRHERNEK